MSTAKKVGGYVAAAATGAFIALAGSSLLDKKPADTLRLDVKALPAVTRAMNTLGQDATPIGKASDYANTCAAAIDIQARGQLFARSLELTLGGK